MPVPSTPNGEASQEACVLLGHGELDSTDKKILENLLERFGITPEFMTPEEFEATKNPTTTLLVPPAETPDWQDPNKYSILNINDTSQWLVKEHFRDYGFKMLGTTDKKRSSFGIHFGYLLCGDGHRTRHNGYQQPPPPVEPLPHIIAKERSVVGIEPTKLAIDPYTPVASVAARYAIQTGSMLEYAHSILNESSNRTLNTKEKAICQLSVQLSHQITN